MPYLDKEEKFYDYHTSDIDGNNIFDIHKASNSDAQQLLDGSKYWREEKNTYSEIVEMTPFEYFEACARDCFDESTEQLIQSRRRDENTLEHLKQVILKYKKRFPICYIDYATHHTPSQEGLHRMMVAGDLIGWDTKFPVQIIKWVDQDRANQEKEWKHKREIERYLQRAVDRALRYKYYNIKELEDQLYSEFETEVRYVDEFEDRVFKLDLTDSGDTEDPGLLVIIDNKYECFISLSEIQWLPKKDEVESTDDLEDLDVEDLSDWMKELLSEEYAHINNPDSFLVSNELLDQLEEEFGNDYYKKNLCEEVCKFVKSKCNQCELLSFAIGVFKLGNYELEPISTKGHCVIRYNNKVYDYTSNQYDSYGITPARTQPRILTYNDKLSKKYEAEVYSDNDYIVIKL